MSVYILTSMFPNGFDDKAVKVFRQEIAGCNRFAFIASEFENGFCVNLEYTLTNKRTLLSIPDSSAAF